MRGLRNRLEYTFLISLCLCAGAQKPTMVKISRDAANWERLPEHRLLVIEAEDYHQDYFRNHPNAPYCAVVIGPKLEKLKPKLAKP